MTSRSIAFSSYLRRKVVLKYKKKLEVVEIKGNKKVNIKVFLLLSALVFNIMSPTASEIYLCVVMDVASNLEMNDTDEDSNSSKN